MKRIFTALFAASALALAVPAVADDDKNESGKAWRKDAEKRDKDARKAEKEWRKDAEKREKEARKAEKEWRKEARKEARERDTYFHRHGHTHVAIPDGHLPPPGQCRLWYPDRPAGHQPPPFPCSRAQAQGQVQPGAWMLRRQAAAPRQFDVVVYDRQRPGTVVAIGIFDAATGNFLNLR